MPFSEIFQEAASRLKKFAEFIRDFIEALGHYSKIIESIFSVTIILATTVSFALLIFHVHIELELIRAGFIAMALFVAVVLPILIISRNQRASWSRGEAQTQ